MAIRGRPIPATTVAAIVRLRGVLSLRGTARETDVSPPTVIKYVRGAASQGVSPKPPSPPAEAT